MLHKNGTIPLRHCRIMFQQLRFRYKKKWVRAISQLILLTTYYRPRHYKGRSNSSKGESI